MNFLVGAAGDWLDGIKPPRPADQRCVGSCDLERALLLASGGLDNATPLSIDLRDP
ncbi:MAG: hypothetical protein ACK2UJ_02240 [Candidatus Promineifilaceae bacterium]